MENSYITIIVLFIVGLILLLAGFFGLFARQDPRNPSKVPGLLIAIGSVLLFMALVLSLV